MEVVDLKRKTIVWATLKGIKVQWPCRAEKEDKGKDMYWVYCHSDDMLLPSKHTIPFNHADSMDMKEKALRVFVKKPQMLKAWLEDLDWAEKNTDQSNFDNTQPYQVNTEETGLTLDNHNTEVKNSGEFIDTDQSNSDNTQPYQVNTEETGLTLDNHNTEVKNSGEFIDTDQSNFDNTQPYQVNTEETGLTLDNHNTEVKNSGEFIDTDQSNSDNTQPYQVNTEETGLTLDNHNTEVKNSGEFIDTDQSNFDNTQPYQVNTEETGLTLDNHNTEVKNSGEFIDTDQSNSDNTQPYQVNTEETGLTLDNHNTEVKNSGEFIDIMPSNCFNMQEGALNEKKRRELLKKLYSEKKTRLDDNEADEKDSTGTNNEDSEEEDAWTSSGSEFIPDSELENSSDISSRLDTDKDESDTEQESSVSDMEIDYQVSKKDFDNQISDIEQDNQEVDIKHDSDKEDDIEPCEHKMSLKEADIIRDEKYSDIFIRRIQKSKYSITGRKKKTERVWDNYHCCFICKQLSTNIIKHILTHKTNEKVKALAEKKESLQNSPPENMKDLREEIRKEQAILRNKGDHLHNQNVKYFKKGELIVDRRAIFIADEYGPCPSCLEWIKDGTQGKHQKKCPAQYKSSTVKQTKKEILVKSSALKGEILDVASKTLIKEVYTVMNRDSIGNIAREDPCIVGLGNKWIKRNVGNQLKRPYYTSSRMRGAARLLENVRQLTSSSKAMIDYLKPQHFDHIAQAALSCGTQDMDDEEDLSAPSAALKIGFDIERMVHIKLGIALRSEDKTQAEEAEGFLRLMKMEWYEKVRALAHHCLREQKLKKPDKKLPIPEDLCKLGQAVVKELKSFKCTEENFRRGQVLVQTRLLTYNKRRAGELEALRIVNYNSRSTGLDEADRSLLMTDMTEVEKHLAESQELIQIRGKNGKCVPVLVTDEVKPILEYITSPDARKAVGVKSWNPYVFANSGEGVIRAYDSLKTICAELNLVAPERITSVSMRKYIATISQVIDMKDYELEWLCKHLGHTADIHKLHYRATSGFIERVNMGKLMLIQDYNLASKFAGKRLQDIDIGDILVDNSKDNEDKEDTLPQQPGESDFGVEDEFTTVAKRICTRQKWTQAEEEEIKQLFRKNFDTKSFPGLKDCNAALAESRRKNGNIHKRSWETVKKKVIRMIKK